MSMSLISLRSHNLRESPLLVSLSCAKRGARQMSMMVTQLLKMHLLPPAHGAYKEC